jgi:hypothetical protein
MVILKIKKSQCPPSFSAKSSPCSAHPRFDFLIQFFTLNQARCSGSFVRIFGDQGPGLPQSHIAVDGR